MAVNNAGAQLDSAGEIAVDFVWGNFAPQPNDSRTNRLNLALGDHINLESGWNGFPSFIPNTPGSDVAGSIDYVKVLSVLGKTTADADDVMKDTGLTVTTAAGATNAAISATAAARTSGSTTATVTATGAGAAFPVGTKVVIAGLATTAAELNGTWTVTASATNTVSFVSSASTAIAYSGAAGTIVGLAGTIRTQSIAAGAATTAVGAAVTITPWATAS